MSARAAKMKGAAKKNAGAKKKSTVKKTTARGKKKAGATKKAVPRKASPKRAAAKKTAKKKTAKKKVVKKVAKKTTARKVAARKAPAKKTAKKKRPTARELAPYKKRLLLKQRELMQAYAAFKGDSQAAMDDGTEDYIDYAVSSYAKEFMLSLTEMDRRQLRLVEEALRRIERRDYGRCLNCGTVVPPPRLEVAPWAQYCVRCQELDEQGLLVHHPVPGDGADEAAADEVIEEGELEEAPEVEQGASPSEDEDDLELEEADSP